MNKEYRIEHVRDFLAVPEDRLATCLDEFRDFIEMSMEGLVLVRAIEKLAGRDAESIVEAFVWIDDGQRKKTLVIQPVEGRG